MNESASWGVKVLWHFVSLCTLRLDMQSISFYRSQSETSGSRCPSLRTCGGCDAGHGNEHGWSRTICWDPHFSNLSVRLNDVKILSKCRFWFSGLGRECWDFSISIYIVGSKASDPEILSSAAHKNHMGSFQNHWCPRPHPRTIKLESLGWGSASSRFKSSPGDSNVQSEMAGASFPSVPQHVENAGAEMGEKWGVGSGLVYEQTIWLDEGQKDFLGGDHLPLSEVTGGNIWRNS